MTFRPCLIKEANLIPAGALQRYGDGFPSQFIDLAIVLIITREGRFFVQDFGAEDG